MSEARGKPGLFRRLSFRRRRPRSPPVPDDARAAAAQGGPAADLPLTPVTPPPRPPPTPTPTLTSRSTSMSTLDVALAGRPGDLNAGVLQDSTTTLGAKCCREHEDAASDRGLDSRASDRALDSRASDRGLESTTSDRALESRASDRGLESTASVSVSEESQEHEGSASRRQSSAAALAELNRVLLSGLECPVCYTAMAPPIRQCLFGHSVCARCEARLARCPTCRAAFLAAPNATLNAIAVAVRLPCRHRAAGCRQHLALADKARHEDHCPHREFACPDAPPHCAWRGPLSALLEHTLSEHAGSSSLITLNQYAGISYTYSRGRPFEVREMDGSVSHVAKTLLLVETGDSEDNNNNKQKSKGKERGEGKGNEDPGLVPRALFRLHLRFDAGRVLLQAVLQLVGPPATAALFRYKVSVASQDGAFALSAWSTPTCEDVEEAVADGKLLRVDSAAFRHLVDADGRFLVRVKVVVGKLPCLVQPA